MNKKSKVVVLPCETYEEERIYQLMKNGLEELGGVESLIRKEEKILLKPNLLKKAEVEKLKIEQGVQDMEEPAVNLEAGNFHVNLEGGNGDESKSGIKNVPNEPEGIPGDS